MKTNIKQFLRDFKANQQKVLEASEKVVNDTLLDMYKKIVDRTPVGDPSLWNYPAPPDYTPGTLKASWQIVFNSSGAGRDPSTGRFTSIGSALNKGGISFKVGSSKQQNALIYNPQPYAQRVETGWSTQAPQGMMRITIAEYTTMMRRNTARYRIR